MVAVPMGQRAGTMVYCTKCGTENDDDAAFCKKCGAPMASGGTPPPPTPPPAPGPEMYPPGKDPDRRRGGRRYEHERDWDHECEEDCSGPGRRFGWLWGVIIILIGLFIVFEAGIKNIEGLPSWVYDIQLWWVVPVLIGIVIIMVGVEAIGRSGRR